MKIKNHPATTEGNISGNIISLNLLNQLAPEICPASSSEGLICESADTTVRIHINIYFIMYDITRIAMVLYMFILNLPDIVIIRDKAITTLGVPDPTVIRKSGIPLPFIFVRFNK